MKEPEENLQYNKQHAKRIAYLVGGFLNQSLTEEEETELDDWINESNQNLRLFEDLTDPETLKQSFAQLDNIDTSAALSRINAKLRPDNDIPVIRSIKWWRYAAAAAIVVLVGSVAFLMLRNVKEPLAISTEKSATDIAPGGSKAMLTLSDGSVINLGENNTNVISREKATVIRHGDGQLIYASNATAPAVFNTLTTPRGGQYIVTLPDGSKVWLNAGSSLKYPVAFTGNTREVELTGEAYFEVAKKSDRPFLVTTTQQQVEVLGTHFNINAYGDEPAIKTTLLEGKVKISATTPEKAGGNSIVLQPGQQAILSGEKLSSIAGFDALEITAWKDGNFEFKDATIDQIMRQVARWYDAEIIYQEKPTYHFNASVSRNVPVSKLLQFLEATNRVHFIINGKKIIVKS